MTVDVVKCHARPFLQRNQAVFMYQDPFSAGKEGPSSVVKQFMMKDEKTFVFRQM